MTKTRFLGLLSSDLIGYTSGRAVHRLSKTLVWVHELMQVETPAGFETDFASVPRLPIIYTIWGDRAHREAVLHDYLYRKGALILDNRTGRVLSPQVPRDHADYLFREAMIGQGRSWGIYQPMYWAVRMGGGSSYHRMHVADHFPLDEVA